MKIKENYKLRTIAGENLILDQGKGTSDMTKIISLNESALFLWKKYQGKNFSSDEMIKSLMEEYNIPNDTATTDVNKWIEKLMKNNMLE